MTVALTENKQTILQEIQLEGYYAARAGADAMASYLITNPTELNRIIQQSKIGPSTGTIEGREFEIYVTGTEHEFIIESVSYETDGEEGSRVYLTMKEINLLDHAIFADQIINVGNNTTIHGNIGTNSNYINFGHNDINGNITLGVGSTTEDVENANKGIASGYVVNTMSTPMNLPSIDPTQFPVIIPNGTIVIDTQQYSDKMVSNKLNATINSINISGNTEFHVKGGGQVHLFVTGAITASGNSVIKTDENTELYIYSNTSGTITFSGTPTPSNITIYAPKSTIAFNGGGSNSIKGSFIAETFVGPSSNVIITQGTGNMEDLNLTDVAGYYRATWSN